MSSTTAALSVFGQPYPDLVGVTRPNPLPGTPQGWDVFTPPVTTSAPNAGTPTLTGLSPPIANPGETVTLTGEALSVASGVDVGRDTQFKIYGQTLPGNGAAGAGLIQRLRGQEAAVTVPSAVPQPSMYLLWPQNANGCLDWTGTSFPEAGSRSTAAT